MPTAERTRLYLQSKESLLSRFLWFHNSRPNEMLMGINGLVSPGACLDSEYPERDVSPAEMIGLSYQYKDAKNVRTPIDHITCHADGTFHIRTHDRDLYVHRMKRVEPLGPDTPTFLEFMILSDRAKYYMSTTEKPKARGIALGVGPEQIVNLIGMFSGSGYDLEREFGAIVMGVVGQPFTAIRLSGNTLKGLLYYHVQSPPDDVFKTRPRGTTVIFRFPIASDRYRLKSFLFS